MTSLPEPSRLPPQADTDHDHEPEREEALHARYLRELHILRDVALAGAQAAEEDVLLEQVTRIIGNTFFPDNFGVLLLDENEQVLIPHPSYHGALIKEYAPVPLNQGITGYVARTGQSVIVPDVSQNGLYLSADGETRSELCVPLIADDHILGVVNAESMRLDAFTAADERLMITLSSQLATALQKIRLLAAERRRRAEAEAMREASRRYAEELETLFELSTALRQAVSVEAMLPVILRASKEAAGAIMSVAALMNQKGDELVMQDMLPPAPIFWQQRYPLHEGITGRVAQSKMIYHAANLFEDPVVIISAAERAFLQEIGAKGLLGVPLRTSQKLIGLLFLVLGGDGSLAPEKVQLVEAMAEIMAGALQRALIMGTLEQRVADRTRELAAANERLKELDRLKSRFISDVSHELRTPITNLGLYLDLIERGRPEKQEHYWRVLRQQTDRLKFLIEDILRLSRIDVGQEEIAFQAVDLNTLSAEVVAEYKEQAADKGLALIFSPAATLPFPDGEPTYLKQVVANLLVNAINFTPAGSVTLKTAYLEDKGEVRLQVTDTGPGIALEDQPHIFERFYRGWNPSTSRAPGTGLGLSLVQEIVRLHNGETSVESEPGHGTTFTVRLPVG